MKTKNKQGLIILLLFFTALLFRIILSIIYVGHSTDMGCFIGWSDLVFKEGLSGFYKSPSFTDYPPGYMYILYLIGGFRSVFHIGANTALTLLITKLPACLCDLIAGVFLYKLAIKHDNNKNMKLVYLIIILYIFNPAILINSAVWGQVDAVFTLFVVLACYFIQTKNLKIAYFLFAIGILIKPQTLIFTPVIIYAFLDEVFRDGFDLKRFLCQMKYGILAIGSMFLLMLPFGIGTVIRQYTDTLGSYEFASVNAYNMWTALGLNWQPQTGKFLFLTYKDIGMICIVALVVFSAVIFFKAKHKETRAYLTASFIVTAMFTLSVRMHERYLFPALILFIATFTVCKNRKIAFFYAIYSILQFFNAFYVLFIYDVNNFDPKEMVPRILSIITCIVFIAFIIFICKEEINWKKDYIKIQTDIKENFNNVKEKEIMSNSNRKKNQNHKNKQEDNNSKIEFTKRKIKLTKVDIIAILIIMLVYSIFALRDLGDNKAPETQWRTTTTGESFLVDLKEDKYIANIAYFLGNYEGREFSVYTKSHERDEWKYVDKITMNSVFAWGKADIPFKGRYVKFTSDLDKAALKELVFLDTKGKKVMPLIVKDSRESKLFDEQDLYKTRSTFRDSTYFDEIYHARTAYEYIEGEYSYENTHPPLGKIFISVGIRIFGMNPFGWRIAGTLFGIAMIPVIFLFAKAITRKSFVAVLTTLLFSFDFMHFAQTRIATIDVFVTFFIILMYYLMYRYFSMSFYDTEFKKTIVPLALSGIAMGFAIACKWTGIYAGVGLAILFFYTLYKRYREYKYAKLDPEGSTNDISHQYVIDHFGKFTRNTILLCIVFFVIIPAGIYLLSYIPFVDAEHNTLLVRMIKNQQTMFSYHSGVNATHPYSSWWYEWPIMYRPIWYYSGTVSNTVAEGISAFGNPLVWWTGIVAFIYMIYRWFTKKDNKALFLIVAYLSQYLPWIFVTRITFIYHYFPSVPFVVLMLGYSIYLIVKEKPKLKPIAYAYVGAAIILFIMFYPVLSGQPVNKDYVSIFLRWFGSWVLV